MYYDDEARRFNFASGLLLGAVLGTGLALLASPQKRRPNPRRIGRSAAVVKGAAKSGLERVPNTISELRSAARQAAR
ncbi:MAG: YtxH domain-containing protein [Gemmatimonadota bacterium]